MTSQRTARQEGCVFIARVKALRGLGVTVGPLMVLEALLSTSVGAVLFAAAARPRASRGLRWVQAGAASGVVLAGTYGLAIRRWMRRWGATAAEARRSLPGDDLVPRARGQVTRAITIRAPAAAVWPWLVQMGQGRAGLYSYDWLESLAGLDIHSLREIIPGLQDLKVGDVFPLGQGKGPRVAILAPNTAQALHQRIHPVTGADVDPSAAGEGPVLDWSWAFTLEPAGPGRTRLIVRVRYDMQPPGLRSRYMAHLIEVPHFIMERKMLLGIRDRAERGVRHRAQPTSVDARSIAVL